MDPVVLLNRYDMKYMNMINAFGLFTGIIVFDNGVDR
jgi:hypothetical protein